MPRPTLELSMIVRNGERTLERCLASTASLVDRIVIGGTGSTDGTPDIARRYGAEIVSIPWTNDFAAARNRVLAHARCDWILVLDADELLDAKEAADSLPPLLEDARVHAYTLHRWDYVRTHSSDLFQAQPNPGVLAEARTYPAYVRSFHIRLFRPHPGIFFEHCVHEHITGRLDALSLTRLTAIGGPVIHHLGYVEDDPAKSREKNELYYQLGLRKLAKSPHDFDTHFQLGIAELQQFHQPAKALSRFRHAAGLRPHDGRAPLYGGLCLLRLGRLDEARQALLRAQFLGECNGLLYDALGDTYLRTGKYAKALAAYRQAQFLGNTSPLVAAKRGTAEAHLGHIHSGMARIENAIASAPNEPVLLRLLELSRQSAASIR
jgi:tetratricopeptide (TPR) repeat protein